MTQPTPRLQSIQQVSTGWINKYLLAYTMPDGTTYNYEAVSRKPLDAYRAALENNAHGDTRDPHAADAVCIVPILDDGSILLIREFRYAVNGWVIAFPAGLLEPGEDMRDCIDRELREETGYRVCETGVDGAEPIRPLPQTGYSSVGMGEENVRVVVARVEPYGEAELEPSEFIETFVLKPEEIGEFLETNRDLIGTRCQLLLEALRCGARL